FFHVPPRRTHPTPALARRPSPQGGGRSGGLSLPPEGRVDSRRRRMDGWGRVGSAPTSLRSFRWGCVGSASALLCSGYPGRSVIVPRTRVSAEMRQKARSLRNHATRAETLLWYKLRDLKSQGIKFRRQCPIGPYIVDFFCPTALLVVEVDGDSHEREEGKRHDANRDAFLRSLGYEVLRVDEPDVIHSAWHV